ncbi:MAG: alpha/beta hydrolase [Verrucomicrobiaceae bacterium]|nr:MAG: alpha/beta hydrolase [Verrucomicrobiaceae bacterium]
MSAMVTTRNNVKIMGHGPRTMVFAHGFGCDQSMWRFVAPAFARHYRVVLFDYAGSGGADPGAYDPRKYSRLDGYAQDVLGICEELAPEKVIFVGHSVSAIIGLLAANQRPELFSGLIMIGPSPCYINDPPDYFGGFERADLLGLFEMMDRNYIGWAKFLAPVIMKNPDLPELANELEESFCAIDPAIARRFAEATFFSDNRADLAKSKVPSLIMQCSDDAIAPPEVGEFLHRELPDSTLVVMRATGHCPHLSHPAETIEVISGYLGIHPPCKALP